MEPFISDEICSSCGGKCCKYLPCGCFPSDFNLPDEILLRQAISSGRYCIDSWEGDPREDKDMDGDYLNQCYFIRPSIKESEDKVYDPLWGGECTFLTSHGCELPYDNRPYGWRMLEPIHDDKCIDHSNGKCGAAIAWIPYQ